MEKKFVDLLIHFTHREMHLTFKLLICKVFFERKKNSQLFKIHALIEQNRGISHHFNQPILPISLLLLFRMIALYQNCSALYKKFKLYNHILILPFFLLLFKSSVNFPLDMVIWAKQEKEINRLAFCCCCLLWIAPNPDYYL